MVLDIPLEWWLSAIFFKIGRTTLNIISTYTTAIKITYKELVKVPALAIAITAASKHQAVISSMAAQVITIGPTGDLLIPFSCTIRAKTGKAVILIAIPINSANETNPECACVKSSYIKYASNAPNVNGKTMLA